MVTRGTLNTRIGVFTYVRGMPVIKVDTNANVEKERKENEYEYEIRNWLFSCSRVILACS